MKCLVKVYLISLMSFNIMADNLTETSFPNSNYNKEEAERLYYNGNYNGNYKVAIDYLDKLIEISPTDYELYAMRGDCHKQEGNYELALEDTMKSLDINKNTPAYMTLIALSREKQDPVLDNLKEMSKKQPEQSKWLYYLGKVYYHNGDLESAKHYYENAYNIDGKPVYLRLIEDCQAKIEEQDTFSGIT